MSCTRASLGSFCPWSWGSARGQTCWRRRGCWQREGVFDGLHRILLAELSAAGELDWTHACVDGSLVRAKKGETRPVRGRPTGGRLAANTICDGKGTPLHVITTAVNVNDIDITQTLALVVGAPPVTGRPGRPRRRSESILGDKAYDSRVVRR